MSELKEIELDYRVLLAAYNSSMLIIYLTNSAGDKCRIEQSIPFEFFGKEDLTIHLKYIG